MRGRSQVITRDRTPSKTKIVVLRHVEEVSGNVAASATVTASARQVHCVWRRQFDEGGVEGLLSTRPHSHVRRLSLDRGRADSTEAEHRPNGFHGDRTAHDRPSTTTTRSTPPSVRSTASISCSPMQSLRDPTRVCADRAAVILASGPPPRSCRPDYAHPRSRSGRRSPTTGSADADTAGGIEATARQSGSSLTSTVRDRSPQHEQNLLPDRLASSVPLGGPHSRATPVPPTDVFSPVSLSANSSHGTETGNRTMFCTPGLPPGSVEKQRAARTVSGSELAGRSSEKRCAV